MSSPKMSIAMATLVLGLLAATSPTAVAVKTRGSNCPDDLCGNDDYFIPYYGSGYGYYKRSDGVSIPYYGSGYYNSIPYPFGIGPDCSLRGFSLACPAGSYNTSSPLTPWLGNPSTKVLGFDMVWFNDFSFVPSVLTNISYFVELAPAQNYSVHWEAPGRPFAISGWSNMSLFVVGCGLEVSFTGDSGVEVGNCSVTCLGDEFMDRLPEGLCIGIGCCRIDIGCCRIDIMVPLRAFTLNISRTGQSTRPLEHVNAFIASNYSQYDGYSFRFRPWDLGSDLTGNHYPVDLIWAIPYQPNCKRAMEDKTNYACVSNHSECQEAPIAGYTCKCAEGSDGNPYVVNGCVLRQPDPPPPDYDSMQPKANCLLSCGNVSFAFPFGTEVGCFAKLQLYLECDPGPTPPILRLSDGSVVTDVSIDKGSMRVLKSSDPNSTLARMDSTLYAFSGEWVVLKWVVDNMSCKDAKASKKGYRCFSHSDCVDVTDDKTLEQIGYRCKCSQGFAGNPYLEYGCTDINECLQSDKYTCRGICQNTYGNYTCTACPGGTDFNDITGKCKPSTIILGVTIGLSSGGGVLFLATIIYILTRRWKRSVQKRFRKRHFRKNKGILLEQLISSDESASDGTKIFSLEELEKATNNFDHTRVVGRGGHGTVYKGILSDQRVVAIKRSQVEASSEIEQFINEVSLLSQINHRNVVKLHGCCLEVEVPLLVYEFISNDTLYDLLHQEQNGILLPLPLEERLRIAIEIAGALTYLHSAASVSILHRDVKSMNVLLNDSYMAKVSDFGASRSIPIDQTHLVTAVQGTFGYLDPEYYHTGQLNEKSDVYSFGVILLELLTRKKPIFDNGNGEKQNLSNYFLWVISEKPLEEVVDDQIMCEQSKEAITSMVRLAQECLNLKRGDRPTMKDVEMRLQMLRGRQSVAPPRCDGERISGHGGAVRVPIGQHGSRQYSLEQEFLSSSRVPR